MTTTTTATADTILAIDLGPDKFVASAHHRSTAAASFDIIPTDRGQLPIVAIPPQQTRQWRALIAGRQVLVGRRVVIQNRIRALLVGQGLPGFFPARNGRAPGPAS